MMLLVALLITSLRVCESFIHDDNLAARVKENYAYLVPCLQNNPNFRDPDKATKWSPANVPDIYSHYQTILSLTAKYRVFPYHKFETYTGPWIENYFINRFIDKPIQYFGGIIPLFVQWSDYSSAVGDWDRTTLFDDLKRVLRRDVIYCLVSQANVPESLLELVDDLPNILIFGAGGFGHIALPLIKGELINPNASDPVRFDLDIGFFGDMFHGGRENIFNELNSYMKLHKFKSKFGKSPTWITDMVHTKFNLAPRGYGATSFRLAEIVHLNRIPVYIYSKGDKFAPYLGSNISVDAIGYSGEQGSLKALVDKLVRATDEELALKLQRVKAARYYYTYDGAMDQIDMFFNGPGRLGDLRCMQVFTVHTWAFWWNMTKKKIECLWYGWCQLLPLNKKTP